MVYSYDEMVELWLLHRYHETARTDAQVVRADGIDLRRLAADEMRSWFMNLLDTAPRELLDPDDISDVAPVPVRLTDGRLAITLPESCRRVVGVRLAGWERSATILTDRESVAAAVFADEPRGQPLSCRRCRRTQTHNVTFGTA